MTAKTTLLLAAIASAISGAAFLAVGEISGSLVMFAMFVVLVALRFG